MIDEPGPFDPLATWEAYLREVEKLPDCVSTKSLMLQNARQNIVRLRPEIE